MYLPDEVLNLKSKQPEKHFLTNKQDSKLLQAHRQEKEKRIADRIKTILNLNDGYSFGEISIFLLLDDDTLRSYFELYNKDGLEGLQRLNY